MIIDIYMVRIRLYNLSILDFKKSLRHLELSHEIMHVLEVKISRKMIKLKPLPSGVKYIKF